MGFELRERWSAQPLWARWVLAVYLIGLIEGTGSHIADLVRGGIYAYAAFHQVSLQVFFVGLVILDPLAAVLVGLVRREGIWLASAVMVLDVSANLVGQSALAMTLRSCSGCCPSPSSACSLLRSRSPCTARLPGRRAGRRRLCRRPDGSRFSTAAAGLRGRFLPMFHPGIIV
ncbi:hypothetical protein [Streptomyces spiralis]|uniref:hypothetical protein n=1 Tax=Streptomyces spiralis TaxID=66376 RepID=UPI003677AF0B